MIRLITITLTVMVLSAGVYGQQEIDNVTSMLFENGGSGYTFLNINNVGESARTVTIKFVDEGSKILNSTSNVIEKGEAWTLATGPSMGGTDGFSGNVMLTSEEKDADLLAYSVIAFPSQEGFAGFAQSWTPEGSGYPLYEGPHEAPQYGESLYRELKDAHLWHSITKIDQEIADRLAAELNRKHVSGDYVYGDGEQILREDPRIIELQRNKGDLVRAARAIRSGRFNGCEESVQEAKREYTRYISLKNELGFDESLSRRERLKDAERLVRHEAIYLDVTRIPELDRALDDLRDSLEEAIRDKLSYEKVGLAEDAAIKRNLADSITQRYREVEKQREHYNLRLKALRERLTKICKELEPELADEEKVARELDAQEKRMRATMIAAGRCIEKPGDVSAPKQSPDSMSNYGAGQGGRVHFPLGELSFADEVVSYKIGDPAPSSLHANLAAPLGPPDYDAQTDRGHLSLGGGGVLVLRFVDNALIDVPGPDLFVFEIGPSVEATHLEISKDGRNWIDIGRVEGATAQADISPFTAPGDVFYFVRLTDLRMAASGNSPSPGADIDAVGAIGSRMEDNYEIRWARYRLETSGGAANRSLWLVRVGYSEDSSAAGLLATKYPIRVQKDDRGKQSWEIDGGAEESILEAQADSRTGIHALRRRAEEIAGGRYFSEEMIDETIDRFLRESK